jgi:hypothetical protein
VVYIRCLAESWLRTCVVYIRRLAESWLLVSCDSYLLWQFVTPHTETSDYAMHALYTGMHAFEAVDVRQTMGMCSLHTIKGIEFLCL